jgi:predicted nucleotide-binding protein
MKTELEEFIRKIPDLDRMPAKELVAFFAFFLTEVMGDTAVRPRRIRECYDLGALPAPGNISDVIGKSGFFVTTKAGLQLRRSVRDRIAQVIGNGPATSPRGTVVAADATTALTPVAKRVPGLAKSVMVVYGRDRNLRDSMSIFLRALKLNPIEWSEAVRATGKASPYVGEILEAAFEMAQAIVVMLTPDESVQLRRELCSDDAEFARETSFQPRANVLIEAGMALARAEDRTVLVQIGDARLASDIHGRHVVRLDDSPEQRNELAQRLRTAGCEPDTSNPDWYRSGTFKTSTRKKRSVK